MNGIQTSEPLLDEVEESEATSFKALKIYKENYEAAQIEEQVHRQKTIGDNGHAFQIQVKVAGEVKKNDPTGRNTS